MSAQDRAIQKLARELAGIKKEVVSWRGPQADYTSIENGGNFTFKDSAGNVTGIFGGQDDGSTTIRHIDGPTPPVPSAPVLSVDGPIITVEWDGTYENNEEPTFDIDHVDVVGTHDTFGVIMGTMALGDLGRTCPLIAGAAGDWEVHLEAVSKAGKVSQQSNPATINVPLVGLAEAISEVEVNANAYTDAAISDIVVEGGDGTQTIYSVNEPSGDFPKGSTWYRIDENENIIGQWSQDGGSLTQPADEWTPRAMTDSMVTSLNAAKIDAGFISADRLYSGIITSEKVAANAIVAEAIAANAIESGKIAANAVTADKIAANAITAGKITAGAITAGKLEANAINGMTITGALIRTASTGSRVELSHNGLKQYNSLNETVADMTGGTLSMVGNIYQSNAHAEMATGPAWGGSGNASPGISWRNVPNHPAEDPALTLIESTNDPGDYFLLTQGPGKTKRGAYMTLKEGAAAINVSGPGYNTAYVSVTDNYAGIKGGAGFLKANNSEVRMSHGDSYLYSSDDRAFLKGGGASVDINDTYVSALAENSNFRLDRSHALLVAKNSSGGVEGFLELQASGAVLRSADGGDLILSGDAAFVRSHGRDLLEGRASGSGILPVMKPLEYMTTSLGANVYTSGGGGLRRVSSSLRYKTDVASKDPDTYVDNLLGLEYRTWIDKGEKERHQSLLEWRDEVPIGPAPQEMAEGINEPSRCSGLIAEEVSDAGLSELVEYDDYGRPESVQYDRIGPALIPIVRDLRERISQLEKDRNDG